jgi:hypothetical protein
MSARARSNSVIVDASSRSMVTCTSTSKPRPIASGSMTEIVEVASAHDQAQITGIAAAHVAYELLSALAARQPAP